jgi:hypothetical protein
METINITLIILIQYLGIIAVYTDVLITDGSTGFVFHE